jgi:hypothetical protein
MNIYAQKHNKKAEEAYNGHKQPERSKMAAIHLLPIQPSSTILNPSTTHPLNSHPHPELLPTSAVYTS